MWKLARVVSSVAVLAALSGSVEARPAKRTKPSHSKAGCLTSCAHAPLFADPPDLSPLDREVLAMCPDHPAAAVSRGEVRRFVAAHYDDPRLQTALSVAGRPGSGAGVKEANVDWLVELWVGKGPRNAFTHVFCGDDWDKKKLGGLHYLPRYAALETAGKLCYGGPAKGSSPARDGQYLIRYSGVAPFSCGEKSVGGFAASYDPIAILATGTRAFVECCGRDRKKEGGVYLAPDLGKLPWRVWCGTRNGTYGIASLYPTDERPSCGVRDR